MNSTLDILQVASDIVDVQRTQIRIQGLEQALNDALHRLDDEKKWGEDLESAIQEAVDNEDLSQLEGVNRMITCPKCGDRKGRGDELCPSCDRGNEP